MQSLQKTQLQLQQRNSITKNSIAFLILQHWQQQLAIRKTGH